MRYAALLGLFALEASALHVGRREVTTKPPQSSSTPSPSSKTPTTTTTTTLSPAQETNKDALCNNGFTRENWIKYEMDYWLEYWSSTYPMTVDGGNVTGGTDWVNFLAAQTKSLSNIHCEAGSGQCHLGGLSNTAACEKDPRWTPIFFFALSACENLFDWNSGVNNALQKQANAFQTQVMGIVTTFTSHDVSGDSASAILTMIGGLLGGISGLLGPISGGASSALGAASGLDAFANGAQSSMQANYAQLLQNELNTYSSIEDLVGRSIVLMQNATMMVVENAINVAPDNSGSNTGNYWYDFTTSAPYLMRNGSFAVELPNYDYNILSGELTQYINSSAVAAAWVQQNVFIAKRTDDISGTAPCDMDLDKLDGARACSPDGSTAYFFMVSQELVPSYAWGDYSGTPGVSNVGDYGLDLYTMATAAEWVQDNYFNSTGYFPNVSPTDMVKDFTSQYDPLPNGYFINIPVMDADGLSPPDLYDQGGADLGTEALFIVEVMNELPNLNNWPYSIDYN